MKLNAKAILQAESVNVNLQTDAVELLLDDGQSLTLSYNDLTIMEAVLLKLKFADPVISPGKSTGDIFKALSLMEQETK
jgi:hypothetical protein